MQNNAKVIDLYKGEEIIGKSKVWQDVMREAKSVANFPFTVLLEGESGTGKEVIAKFIHKESGLQGNFVPVNCGTISNEFFESELFGHKKGAFTGADSKRMGTFELANNGIIFLDEIADLIEINQVKLLRVLEEREIKPLGSEKIKKINFRVILATNKNLEKEVEKGNFREDLYYRVNSIKICLPSLRERKEDIRELAIYFLYQEKKVCSTDFKLSEEILTKMRNAYWKGNVRDIKSSIERLIVEHKKNKMEKDECHLNEIDHSSDRQIESDRQIKSEESNDFLSDDSQGTFLYSKNSNLKQLKLEFETHVVLNCLRKNSGNIKKTAEKLKANRSTLSMFLKKIKDEEIEICENQKYNFKETLGKKEVKKECEEKDNNNNNFKKNYLEQKSNTGGSLALIMENKELKEKIKNFKIFIEKNLKYI